MSMFNIGLSGALANKIAMNVTANNTANVNNENYTRQVTDMSARINGVHVGSFSLGSGVGVDSIRRVTDAALVERVRISGQEKSYSEAYYYGMAGVENTFGTEGLNITDGLSTFFSTFDEASLTPESPVYRNQILNSATDIAGRFNQIISQLNDQKTGLYGQHSTIITQANSDLASIANLNKKILETSSSGGNIAALQDALDTQLNTLSEKMQVNVLRNANGTVELSTSTGSPLVQNDNYATLTDTSDNASSFGTSIRSEFMGMSSSLSGDIGGQLGSINDLIQGEILPNIESINNIAESFATKVNELLGTGIDLNGKPGKPLFEFDVNDPAGSLKVTDILGEELRLSSDGNIGNGDIATSISSLANEALLIGGESSTLFDAYSQVIGGVGLNAKLSESRYTMSMTNQSEAKTAKSNLSGINSDEEAVNLMQYMNAYSANMKVISTAKDMFDTVLNAF